MSTCLRITVQKWTRKSLICTSSSMVVTPSVPINSYVKSPVLPVKIHKALPLHGYMAIRFQRGRPLLRAFLVSPVLTGFKSLDQSFTSMKAGPTKTSRQPVRTRLPVGDDERRGEYKPNQTTVSQTPTNNIYTGNVSSSSHARRWGTHPAIRTHRRIAI